VRVLLNFRARHPSTLPTICHISASRLSSISSNLVHVFTKAAQLKPVCVRAAVVAGPGNEPVCQPVTDAIDKKPFRVTRIRVVDMMEHLVSVLWAVATTTAVIGSWATVVPLAAIAAVLALNRKWAAAAAPSRG
jgi:hypothetical protein